jgi:hypothetical protein
MLPVSVAKPPPIEATMLPLAPPSIISFFRTVTAAAGVPGGLVPATGSGPVAPSPPRLSEYHIPAIRETPDPRIRRALV